MTEEGDPPPTEEDAPPAVDPELGLAAAEEGEAEEEGGGYEAGEYDATAAAVEAPTADAYDDETGAAAAAAASYAEEGESYPADGELQQEQEEAYPPEEQQEQQEEEEQEAPFEADVSGVMPEEGGYGDVEMGNLTNVDDSSEANPPAEAATDSAIGGENEDGEEEEEEEEKGDENEEKDEEENDDNDDLEFQFDPKKQKHFLHKYLHRTEGEGLVFDSEGCKLGFTRMLLITARHNFINL